MAYIVAGIIVILIIQVAVNLIGMYWGWILLIVALFFAIKSYFKNERSRSRIKESFGDLQKNLLNQIKLIRTKLYYYFSPQIKKNHCEFVCTQITKIEPAVQEFREFLSLRTYFDSYLLDKWNQAYRPIFLGFTSDLEFLLKQHPSYYLFQEFSKYLELGKSMRVEHNNQYMKRCIEQNKDFFDVIEKQPLTLRQREAVVIDDHRNLVLAGAGTGKTSTLVAKFAFLVEKLNADPSRILILAFNKDAAEEVRVRTKSRFKEIFHKDIEANVSTFHSFGFHIVKQFETLAKNAVEGK